MSNENESRVVLVISDPTDDQAEVIRLPGAGLMMDHYTGETPSSPDQPPVAVTKDNLDSVIRELEPTLTLDVPNHLTGEGDTLSVELTFDRTPDRWPALIVEQVEPLKRLDQIRKALLFLKTKVRQNRQLALQLKKLLAGDVDGLKQLLASTPAIADTN